MKFIIGFTILLISVNGYTQDSLKIKTIDSIVASIDSSVLPIQRDTLIQDRPEMGLKITTYLSMIVHNQELLKYENHVTTEMTEKGVPKHMTVTNTFYFQHNKLLKVEEYLLKDEKIKIADWYYADDKPVYYTLDSDRAASSAALLLTIADTLLKQILK